MNRRTFIQCLGAAPVLASGAQSFTSRFAICNETFQGVRFEEQCRMGHDIGYQGIEVMPATLAENPALIPSGRRAELKRVISDAGLHFIGVHNILSAPGGMHVTTSDAAMRQRSWEFVKHMADLCSDLGLNTVLVFGSSKQRETPEGVTKAEALRRFRDGLASVAGHAQERSVTILIEPLAPHLCNFVNTLEEAAALVRELNHPAVKTMFDVHNTAGENKPAAELIDRYISIIRHVHLNEMDGRRPGSGSYDYSGLFRALARQQYEGWLSLEVFDFRPSGEAVAADALKFLRTAGLSLPGML